MNPTSSQAHLALLDLPATQACPALELTTSHTLSPVLPALPSLPATQACPVLEPTMNPTLSPVLLVCPESHTPLLPPASHPMMRAIRCPVPLVSPRSLTTRWLLGSPSASLSAMVSASLVATEGAMAGEQP